MEVPTRCQLHPKYRGKGRPSDCSVCRLIYRREHPQNRADRRLGQQRATKASKRPIPPVEGNRPPVRCPACGEPHMALAVVLVRNPITQREVAKLVESFPLTRADHYCEACKPMHRQEHWRRRHPGLQARTEPVRKVIQPAAYHVASKAAK